MTRVLFVSHTLDFAAGGAERVLLNVLQRLDRSKLEATVFVGRDRCGVPDEFSRLAIPIVLGARLPMEVKPGPIGILITATALLRLAFGLTRTIARQRFDVVHVNSIFALHFAVWPCRALGVPVVYHEHGLARDREGSPWSRLYASLVKRVAHTIAITEAVRQQVISFGVAPQAVTTVHNGIDAEARAGREAQESSTNRSARKRFAIVQIANFLDWKGQDTLARAMPLVLESVPEATLAFYGHSKDAAYEERVRQIVAREGLDEAVEFGGYRTDLMEFLPHFDCLVVASRAEPFGLVLLEAMREGVPVVASNAGGVPEIVSDGVNGLLFDPDDTQGLASALVRVAREPETADGLRDRGREVVRDRFSFETQVERIESILLREAGEFPRSGLRPAGPTVENTDRHTNA